MESCREYFEVVAAELMEQSWMELYCELTGVDLTICPECKIGGNDSLQISFCLLLLYIAEC